MNSRARLRTVLHGALWILWGAANALCLLVGAGIVVGLSLPTMEPLPRIGNRPDTLEALPDPPPGSTLRFAFIGDVNNIGYDNLRNQVTRAEAGGAQFIVLGGDMVRSATPLRFRYCLMELTLGKPRVPVVVTPGNHDQWCSEWDEANDLYFRRIFGPLDCSFVRGDALFIVRNQDAQWDADIWPSVENEMRAHRGEFRHVFLFTHAPPVNWEGKLPNALLSEETVRRNLSRANELGIDVIFSGHIKQFHRGRYGDCEVICAGGGPARDEGDRLTSLVMVDVKPESFVLTPVATQGVAPGGIQVRTYLVLRVFGRLMDNPLTSALLCGLLAIFGMTGWIRLLAVAAARAGKPATTGSSASAIPAGRSGASHDAPAPVRC